MGVVVIGSVVLASVSWSLVADDLGMVVFGWGLASVVVRYGRWVVVDIGCLCVVCTRWWVVCVVSLIVVSIAVVVCNDSLVCSLVYSVVVGCGS